jgi:hypothetical protein
MTSSTDSLFCHVNDTTNPSEDASNEPNNTTATYSFAIVVPTTFSYVFKTLKELNCFSTPSVSLIF